MVSLSIGSSKGRGFPVLGGRQQPMMSYCSAFILCCVYNLGIGVLCYEYLINTLNVSFNIRSLKPQCSKTYLLSETPSYINNGKFMGREL